MSDNNDTDNVIDFAEMRRSREEGSNNINESKPLKVNSGKFEFHLVSPEGGNETVIAEGYMKFGPQFLAVVDGPEDDSMVLFACATHLVRFIKKVNEDGATQGTLDLSN